MAASGTYAFAPEIRELVDEAFEACGIDPQRLVTADLLSARRSLNFLFEDWVDQGITDWRISRTSYTVVDGTASFALAGTTGVYEIFDIYLTRDGVDTPLIRMSREDYNAIPKKTQEGRPDSFYPEKTTAGINVYLWPVPENSTDVLTIDRLMHYQDVDAAAQTPGTLKGWNSAIAAGLAAKLAVKRAPAKLAMLKLEARETLMLALRATRDRADTVFTVSL